MKKSNWPLIILLLIMLLVFGALKIFGKPTSKQPSPALPSQLEESNNLQSPQPVGPLSLTLTHPEEERIIPGQARPYKAMLTNSEPFAGSLARCEWSYYMIIDDQEIPYHSLENRGVVHDDETDICSHTGTFLSQKGKVKIKLDLTIYNAIENLATVSATKNYMVY